MPSVKVSTKHQISVPSDARRRLGIEPGDRLDVQVAGDAIVLRKRPARASDRVRGLARGHDDRDVIDRIRELRRELEPQTDDRPEPSRPRPSR